MKDRDWLVLRALRELGGVGGASEIAELTSVIAADKDYAIQAPSAEETRDILDGLSADARLHWDRDRDLARLSMDRPG